MNKEEVALEFFEWLIAHDSVVKEEFSHYNHTSIISHFIKEST